MAAVLAILTTTVLGIPLALAIDRNARGTTLLGLSYLYGTGLIYAIELALALTNVHWTALNVTAIAIAITTIAFIKALRTQDPGPRTPHSSLITHHSVLDVATLATIAAHTSYATIARVWEWDFWAIWGLKARAFHEVGTIDWRLLASPWNDFVHPEYPLLLPLNYVYAALLGGEWNDRWLGLITIAFGVALLLIVRGMAATETKPNYAATITFACALFALPRFVGLAESPLIAFAGASVLFIRRAILFDDNVAMRHGAILLGLAASTKNEGVALIVTMVVVLLVVKRKLVLRLWPTFVIAAPWIIVTKLHHFSSDLTRGHFFERLFYRLGAFVPIAATLLRDLAFPWMWLAILIALLAVPHALRVRERFVLLAFVVQIAGYIAIYFGTANDVGWQIVTSWPRLTFHLAVPLLYVTMLMLARTYDSAHAEARSE